MIFQLCGHPCGLTTQGTPGNGSFATPAGATSASQLTPRAWAEVLLPQQKAELTYPDTTATSRKRRKCCAVKLTMHRLAHSCQGQLAEADLYLQQ